MRILPSLLVLTLAFAGRILAADPIVTNGAIPTQSAVVTVGTPPIDLRNYFSVPSITGQVVQFTVPGAGVFNVEMNSSVAPNTVANFLAYVNANRFTNTLIHRSNPGFGIIQGGDFVPHASTPTGTTFDLFSTITKNAAIAMEAGDTLQHTRGTIAMPRNSQSIDSATSGWFINTRDNSSQWSPASALNGSSYAAFGRVTGNGMSVVDTIAGLPVLGGNVTVVNSSTNSALVTVDSATLPANFGPGWVLLGTTVQNVIGNFVTLNANANADISSPTTVPYYLYGDPFNELPVFTNLSSAGSVLLTDLVQTSTIKAVPVFPAAPGGSSVVTFSAVSSDPSLVSALISGSNLIVGAAKNLTGSATVTVTATDSNGVTASLPAFTVNVTRKVVDFNNDGTTDLIFQNNVGQIGVWYGGVPTNSAFIYGGGLGDWRVVGLADINGDGVTDIVFQNNVGQIAVWYSGNYTKAAYIYGGALGDWRVVGLADINGDGVTDIVFQNNVGQVAVWYSGNYTNAAYIYGGGLGGWRVVSIADVNGDGIPDLIFQNSIGQIAVWYSCYYTNAAYIYGGGLGDWRVVRVADINGDGIPDIIFQNNVGQIAVWYNGSYTNAAYIYGGGLGDWRLR